MPDDSYGEKHTMQHNYDSRHQAAYEIGCDAARAQATWMVDGNRPQSDYVRIAAMLDDGDSQAWAYVPDYPSLSGGLPGDPTPRSVFYIVTCREPAEGDTEDRDLINTLADAWQQGVDDTFESEIERLVKEQISQ